MKTKKIYITLLAILLFACSNYSCRKEVVSLPKISHETLWAKSYFSDVLLPNVGN